MLRVVSFNCLDNTLWDLIFFLLEEVKSGCVTGLEAGYKK